MITWLRSVIAFLLAGVLTALTFGRVELDRSGRGRGAGDDSATARPAAARSLDDQAAADGELTRGAGDASSR